MRRCVVWTALLLVVIAPFGFSDAPLPDPVKPDFNTPRPIAAVESVFIEDLTWMEVRDAMRAGKKTVIIATGGYEQNGPYLAAGKHNIVLRGTTAAIAHKLGDALVAPIIGFVPEGTIDPPDLHMLYPTTISLTEDTYRRLLTDICQCYRVHGFENIILLGDSGGNQPGLKEVAEQLNANRKDRKGRLYYIPEYYNYKDVGPWLESQGIKQGNDGLHDDFGMTAQMLAIDPSSVRMKERIAAKKFHINGVDLAPAEKTIAWGKKVIDYRAQVAVDAFHAQLKAN
ncbi:MAG: creatininase family protein [Planctomycetota bacterium]